MPVSTKFQHPLQTLKAEKPNLYMSVFSGLINLSCFASLRKCNKIDLDIIPCNQQGLYLLNKLKLGHLGVFF